MTSKYINWVNLSLTKWSKLISSVIRKVEILIYCMKKVITAFEVFLSKKHYEEILVNLTLKDILQNNWLVLFNSVTVMKDKNQGIVSE